MTYRNIALKSGNIKSILRGVRTSITKRLDQQPSETQVIVQGRTGLTIGMDPALDGGVWYITDGINPGTPIHCPYGEPGDTIRFKERFRILSKTETHARIQYLADLSIQTKLIRAEPSPLLQINNTLDGTLMPFWATRLQAVITSVEIIKCTITTDYPYAWKIHFHLISKGE